MEWSLRGGLGGGWNMNGERGLERDRLILIIILRGDFSEGLLVEVKG